MRQADLGLGNFALRLEFAGHNSIADLDLRMQRAELRLHVIDDDPSSSFKATARHPLEELQGNFVFEIKH